MNYTELSDAIQAYTNNTDVDFIAGIPVFVRQAEQRVYNSVQVANLRKSMTGDLQAGTPWRCMQLLLPPQQARPGG